MNALATSITSNRLTTADRDAITTRLTETFQVTWNSRTAPCSAERIAYAAIGCTRDDLRDSEIAEIETLVLTLCLTLAAVR